MLLKIVREGLGRIIIFVDYITRPKPIKRSSTEQDRITRQAQKMSLYQFYACPFCVRTRRAVHRLNIPMTYRDAKSKPYRTELAENGGKIKVPCLRIEDEGEVKWLYESKDIINYLDQQFA